MYQWRGFSVTAFLVTALFPLFAAFLLVSYLLAEPGRGLPRPWGPRIEVMLVYAPLVAFVSAALLYAFQRCCCADSGAQLGPELQPQFFPSIVAQEISAVQRRRRCAGFAEDEDQWLCSLALAGGGIRQSNFSMGVILALVAKRRHGRPLWRHVDLLPAVSGGGYTATSLVSHLLSCSAATDRRPTDDSEPAFDVKARQAAEESAVLLSAHSNWPMERNWPSCLDGVLSYLAPCGLAGLLSFVALVVMAFAAFLAPFVLLWAITVALLPVSLFFAIDLPHQLGTECGSQIWFLLDRRVVCTFAALLVGLRIAKLRFSRLAERTRAAVNRVVNGVDAAVDDASFQRLRVRHGRAVVGAHFLGSLFGALAMVWLFACAYAAAGLNCGTFMGSHLKTLDLALLGSAALLLLMCQSQQNRGNTIPVVLLVLGGALMYSLACVHVDAFLLAMPSTCDGKCGSRASKNMAGRFFGRKHVYLAIAIWGLHPVLYNVWSFMLPRWYQFKLKRFLHQDKARLTLKDLHDAYGEHGVAAPYLLLCSTVHHIWRWPRREEPRKVLEQLFSSTFIFSAFFVGDDSTGFVPTAAAPHCKFLVTAATALSGAATSNHIIEATTPFHHVLTFFSGMLFGYWMQLEPDGRREQRATAVLLSLAGAMLHFAGAVSLLFAYERCHRALPQAAELGVPQAHGLWACDAQGQRFALFGLAAFVLELCLVPVFMTWFRPLWRMAFFGKWFSEWMQVQGFSFPQGASRVSPLPRHVYVSDGGHISNLCFLEPLRRRSRVVIIPHCGFTSTHQTSNLRQSIQRACDDDTISASFVPLEWKDDCRCFRRVSGCIEAHLRKFAADMDTNHLLVGVEYGESAATESVPLLKNAWGIVVLFANRPVSPSQCSSWGLKQPSEDSWAQLDEALEHTPSSLREPRGPGSTEATPFVQGGGRDRRRTMYSRTGNCFSCCHRLPSRLAKRCSLGSFPNHPTAIQCLSPEVARDYQALGFAVAEMHMGLLEALVQELRREGTDVPPWQRQPDRV